MNRFYILNDEGKAVPEADMTKWARWYENQQHASGGRCLQRDHIDKYFVSTVFLGINYNLREGPPILWETMVFDTSTDEKPWEGKYSERYSSSEEAMEGHIRATQWILERVVK